MTNTELKNKKITTATLKSFIKKANQLYVEHVSAFSGMSDCVEFHSDRVMIEVSKENAIGFGGVYCVGHSRDYFKYMENDKFYGIKVFNSCGSGILWTAK